jgi:TolB protein
MEEIMNMCTLAWRVVVVVLLLSCGFVRGAEEVQITEDSEDQQYPAIYGDYVVWEDNRNGNKDIYGYNLSTGKEFQITSNPKTQAYPAIYGDIVVWEDARNGNYDIYGYNLSNKKEFQITVDPRNQRIPAIYQNIVVWEDDRNGNPDIYGYNLETREEFPITTSRNYQYMPAIYKDYVVWVEVRVLPQDIYLYNLSTGQEVQITTIKSQKEVPSIYEDIIVWHDYRNGDADIYGYDLSSTREFQLTTDPTDQVCPRIYRDLIVWEDNRNGNADIYGYNFKTEEEFQITTDESGQEYPALYSNAVVWEDNRNGNLDIYGYDFSEPAPLDGDNDGYSPPEDCRDNDPEINPGAEEVCDGIDNNCDGSVDEWFDKDNDGFTTCEGDCDDTNPDIHPGAEEPCGTDDNCDGDITPCTGNLEVTVLNPRGEAIPDFNVYIDESLFGRTDWEGKITIFDLETDRNYTIKIEKEGYYPLTTDINVDEDFTTYVEFKIDKRSDFSDIFYVGLLLVASLGLIFLVYILKSRNKEKSPQDYVRMSTKDMIKEKGKKAGKYVCPFCKNEIEEDWISCPYCGVRLRDDAPVYE